MKTRQFFKTLITAVPIVFGTTLLKGDNPESNNAKLHLISHFDDYILADISFNLKWIKEKEHYDVLARAMERLRNETEWICETLWKNSRALV